MKILLLLIFLLTAFGCSGLSENVSKTNVQNPIEQPKAVEQKNYESNFNSGITHFEPVPPIANREFEPIFGKGISLSNHHLFLSAERKARIKTKADLKNLSDEEIAKLNPDWKDGELHTRFVYREKKQLALTYGLNVAEDKAMIIFSTKENEPIISEIRSETLTVEFLSQFAGKGKNDRLKFGEDIFAAGLDETRAKNVTDAIRLDFWIIQTIYGGY